MVNIEGYEVPEGLYYSTDFVCFKQKARFAQIN